jgi:hypothetical protein
MTWNYFTIGHGKREVDGVGALLKREVCKKQMKPHGMKFENTAEIVAFLKAETLKKFFVGQPRACKQI